MPKRDQQEIADHHRRQDQRQVHQNIKQGPTGQRQSRMGQCERQHEGQRQAPEHCDTGDTKTEPERFTGGGIEHHGGASVLNP